MGLALHEIYKVSGLMIGEAPYEKYVLSTEELHLLKKSDPLVHETYWEDLCHFHICRQVTGWKSGGIKQMSWATYLFNLIFFTISDRRMIDELTTSISPYT